MAELKIIFIFICISSWDVRSLNSVKVNILEFYYFCNFSLTTVRSAIVSRQEKQAPRNFAKSSMCLSFIFKFKLSEFHSSQMLQNELK